MEFTPSAAADGSTALWDWDSLLDFSVGIEEDPLILPWGSPDEARSQPPPASTMPAEQPLLSLPEPEQESQPSPATEPASRVRKRDPRLICPNYLAGRVPCSCPEMDEKEVEEEEVAEIVAGARKRVRSNGASAGALRCQVPGCEADIRELKGYHKRHRVCLRCANASSVVLDGEHKRYCQQCGKFHILPDFDEGKRSCRRKLERHNKRRRRRPADSRSTPENEMEAQVDFLADVDCDKEPREEDTFGFACEKVDTILSNTILGRETPLVSEDGQESPDCSLPSLQNDQSNSVVSFAASAEACVDGKAENSKPSFSSTFGDNKSTYSSLCPTGRISFKLYDWNPAEFPRRLRHQIFEWLASMPVELEGYIRPGCTILTVFIAMPQFMWDKLSSDAAHLVRDLLNAPDSLLSGRGTFLIYLSNKIVQILKDGTSLMNIKMEVQAPKLHYVHPPYFEVGKPIKFVLCGSYLDQPKFRSLVSFNGKYLKHNCCRVDTCGKRSYDENGGDSADVSEHEMFTINIANSEAKVFGPVFIEVENMSGISNFVPVLFGSKHICSELERIEEALIGPSHGNNLSGHAGTGAIPDFCELTRSKRTAMSELLLDIAWSIKHPHLGESKNILSSTNIQRLTCLLRFLVQNKCVSILEIMLRSLENQIGRDIFSNLDRLRHDADMELFVGYVNHAKKSICNRTLQDAIPGLDSMNSILGTLIPQNNFKGNLYPLCLPSLHQEEGARNEDDLCCTTALQVEDNIPLVTKDVTHRQCCYPRPGVKWHGRSWDLSFSNSVMRTRIAVVLMVSVVMCFTACIILLHPHKAGVFAVTMRRCLFGDSTQ
ncbi:squamosa promoter-binding-like protein 9 isoform X2 [Typha angustifolia]|uniref:squamosa promoter-binding-like protein 9 isoform X2 n=1 Tax=Typha angustifolia TaxID=59011 RepID=UPI003C2BE157